LLPWFFLRGMLDREMILAAQASKPFGSLMRDLGKPSAISTIEVSGDAFPDAGSLPDPVRPSWMRPRNPAAPFVGRLRNRRRGGPAALIQPPITA
jgi:hypothetical protein